MNAPRVLLLGGAFAVVASTACTFLLSADDQCTTDDDCARRGGDLGNRVCVDAVCRPREAPVTDGGVDAPIGVDSSGPFGCAELAKPNGDPTKPATVEQPVFNVVTTAPVVGAPGKVCSRPDPNCTSPVASITSDDKGVYSAKVFVGFEGFLELKGTAVADMLFMLDPPIRGDSRRPAAPLPTKEAAEFYSQQVTGAPLDPTTGYILARAVDCDFKPLLGVTARLASTIPKTKLFFVYNNTPRGDVDQTNEEGAFGFFNVPVGTALITVNDTATGRKIGQTSVIVRAGFLTIFYLAPSK
jgi:hypothetical protein